LINSLIKDLNLGYLAAAAKKIFHCKDLATTPQLNSKKLFP